MIASSIVEAYAPLFKDYTLDFTKVGFTEGFIPRFEGSDIKKLCRFAAETFKNEDTLLELTGDFVIVGDIHGNIRDLLRILAYTGNPFHEKYLFLGDYVDRGEFSLEVCTLLFALKLALPNSIYLIRGNHEFKNINEKYGFKQEVVDEYDEDLYELFNEAFSYLPLAATINSKYFLVHGGISADLVNIKDINLIHRPIVSENDANEFANLVTDLVWSDPLAINALFLQSPRGYGCLFGKEAIDNFLAHTGVYKIIRAHQCVQGGIESIDEDKLITVFSSSCYSLAPPNKAGSLRIENDHVEKTSYEPIKQLKKETASYKDVKCCDHKVPLCSRLSFTQRSPKPRLPTNPLTKGTKLSPSNKKSHSVLSAKIVSFTARPKPYTVEPQINRRFSTNLMPKLKTIPTVYLPVED